MSIRLKPVHPGDLLREDFMKPLGLSAHKVAKDIGVASIQISQIMRGWRAVSAKTALLLGTGAQNKTRASNDETRR